MQIANSDRGDARCQSSGEVAGKDWSAEDQLRAFARCRLRKSSASEWPIRKERTISHIFIFLRLIVRLTLHQYDLNS